MSRQGSREPGGTVNLSALDLFANAFGALALLLLLVAVNSSQLVRRFDLVIITKRLPVAAEGTEYLAVLSAQGGLLPYDWNVPADLLPQGLELDPQRGEIHGIPASGTGGRSFTVNLTLRDAREGTVSVRWQLQVLGPRPENDTSRPPLVLLTHGPLPDASVSDTYALYLAARGGSGDYRWAIDGLPPGLTLQPSSGLLSGKPSRPGLFRTTLRVTDSGPGRGDAGEAAATAELRVIETKSSMPPDSRVAPQPAKILTNRLPAATQHQLYEVTLAGTGAGPLAWSCKDMPAGLSLREDGTFTGVPRVAGTVRVLISMRDQSGQFAPGKALTLKVDPARDTPAEPPPPRRLAIWVGYLALFLAQSAALYLLRIRQAIKFQALLRKHGVDYLTRADGTASLAGNPNDTGAFQLAWPPFAKLQDKLRRISWLLLAVAVALYTFYALI